MNPHPDAGPGQKQGFVLAGLHRDPPLLAVEPLLLLEVCAQSVQLRQAKHDVWVAELEVGCCFTIASRVPIQTIYRVLALHLSHPFGVQCRPYIPAFAVSSSAPEASLAAWLRAAGERANGVP